MDRLARAGLMLTFDEEKHEYRWAGQVVPSVTQILAPIIDLSRIPADALEVARQKGRAIHKTVELDVAGKLDEDELPEWLIPVLANWRKFVHDAGVTVLASERQVYHPMYRYAGTFDLLVDMRHAATTAMIDIKRSFIAGQATGLQTAAYLEAYANSFEMGSPSKKARRSKRFALRLNESGPYQLEEFTDQSHFRDFQILLSYYNLKRKYA